MSRAHHVATLCVGTIFLFRKMEENCRSFPAKQNLAHPQAQEGHQSLEPLPWEHQAAQWLCLEEPRGSNLEPETPDYILKKVAYGPGGE